MVSLFYPPIAKLCDVIERENQGDYHIPFLLQSVMRWLEEHACEIPGIFRLSGSHEEVRKLIDDLERGLHGGKEKNQREKKRREEKRREKKRKERKKRNFPFNELLSLIFYFFFFFFFFWPNREINRNSCGHGPSCCCGDV